MINVTYWISILGWGLGVGLLTYVILSGLVSLVRRRKRTPRLNMIVAFDRDVQSNASESPDNDNRPSVDTLLGMDSIPWVTIYLVAAGIGFGTSFAIHQFWPVLLSLTPFLLRMWLRRYRMRSLTQTMWLFLVDLRIRLMLRGTLLLALQDVTQSSDNPIAGIIGGYLDAGYRESGIALLKRLQSDLPDLPFLAELLARTEAATSGTLSMDEAIQQVMDHIQREAAAQARENIQQIPSRLILMAFPALLMPAMFLLVFPLAARLIASLSGATWGGGW